MLIDEIRIMMTRYKLSQKEVGEIIGCTQSNVSSKFKNNTFYSSDIDKLLKHCNCEAIIKPIGSDKY